MLGEFLVETLPSITLNTSPQLKQYLEQLALDFGVIFPVCHDMGQEARAMKMLGEGHK